MNKKYYYTIGEVCKKVDLKPYVLRYWEKEFSQIKPAKTKGGNRKYTEKDIQLIAEIKDMLHHQKYTIEGARKKLKSEKIKSPEKNNQLPLKSDKEKKELLVKTLLEIKKILNNEE
ncbi:MAG: transcriptional regulator [Candidatus Cloacimonadota bacterium]|nr:MAG: transcriptional regulator [Candidatus Cloacimonadota bacterium]